VHNERISKNIFNVIKIVLASDDDVGFKSIQCKRILEAAIRTKEPK
jgi:hypothetical protein